MRISDWSSDVCSSDLAAQTYAGGEKVVALPDPAYAASVASDAAALPESSPERVTFLIFGVLTARKGILRLLDALLLLPPEIAARTAVVIAGKVAAEIARSEEHTSELQSLMRISYAVFCLKKKKITPTYREQSIRNIH